MRQRINYAIDAGILVSFLACGLSGLIKLPALGIEVSIATYTWLSVLHDWTGVAALSLSAAHLALHARWFLHMTKEVFGFRRKPVTASATSKAASLGLGGRSAMVALIGALLLFQGSPDAWADHGRRASLATIPQGINYSAASLIDGSYIGTANGYMPSLSVEVVVKNGRISSVKVVQHNETMRWYNAVANVIPNGIVKAQSTAIDVVSGATSSSHGILAAVEDALAKAKR